MALEMSFPLPELQFPLLKNMRDALLGQGTSELQHACRCKMLMVLVATLSVQTIFLRSYYVSCAMLRVGNADTGKMHPQLCPGNARVSKKKNTGSGGRQV